ncbi:hypothetical protein CA13_17810 [Planctomycetes bacterium CA13]|uniref:Uncharacterized protein n=1 Tax=Novipirellula herctigrandis TaxID=2527986 RepID=A0A5C5YZ41_9BACT|nr:hypothetical protein CA13_17810 [Planctomycetes bacterium CA13]
MVTGDCSRKPSGRSVVEQRMSPEHADGRCEEAHASHQEIGRSNQKSCPREWFVGYIVHRHQPQASVVTPSETNASENKLKQTSLFQKTKWVKPNTVRHKICALYFC